MRDDYAALDLFAATGKKTSVARKKLLGLPRRKLRQSAQKHKLTVAFLPLLAKMNKMKKKSAEAADVTLQGWPISLSWSAPQPPAGPDACQAYPLGQAS